MDLVDDVHFELGLRWRELDRFAQLTDIVHPGIGGGVYFENVQRFPFGDVFADVAFHARLGSFGSRAVDGFGEKARHTGLSGSPGTGEEVGMSYAVMDNGIGKGLYYMTLSDHVGKVLRAVFSI